MAALKNVPKKHRIHLMYIPRRLLTNKEEVKPFSSEEQLYPTTTTSVPAFENLTSVLSQSVLSQTTKNQTKVQNIESDKNKTKNNIVPTSKYKTPLIPTDSNVSGLTQIQPEDHESRGWYRSLSSKQQTLFKIFIAILIIVCVASAAVLPPVILLVLSQTDSTSTTTTTLSPCSSTTCMGKETPYHTSMVTALYPFDGNASDSTGRTSGISYGSPIYVTQAYVGSRALLLNNSTPYQYIEISSIDLSRQSFTIQTWLYPTASSVLNDYGIFSQCDFNSICLSISLRNGRFTLSFDSMNVNNNTLIGTTFVPMKEWTHLTVVYDALLYQQQIYVNGRIDSISNGMIASYQRNSLNWTTTIGKSKSYAYGSTYFQGRIDHFTISTGTSRTACQIYNDATLTAYFPFNTIDSYNDYGVNLFNGIASNTISISEGRLGQAIYFSSNTSYFQVQCFPVVRNVTNANPPFTFSLWLKPVTSTGGGSVIHISSLSSGNGSLCYDLLAFTNSGALVVQLMGPTLSVTGLLGPVLPINTWSHIAIIYSSTDGVRLFINGQLSITALITSIPQYMAKWDTPLYITLGHNSPVVPSAGASCSAGSVTFISGSYTGAIDDFRLYNRELDTEELCTLANL